MLTRQLVPENLAEMAPGPELSAVLAGIDLSRLVGYDCVRVVQARYRQLSHERAGLMAAMVESGRCVGGPGDELARSAEPDEYAADEIRAALVLTRRAAENQFWLAYDVVTTLPALHAAMAAGRLDEPRARIFAEWTRELSVEQARALCDALLPRATELTTGELIDEIKKHAIALDPEWARHRYEETLADRKVVGRRNPDGSANLCGYNLPVDRVAAASERIDALAKAAKHAGDSRPIDHIRTELYLGMNDGTYAGLDDTTILTVVRASAVPEPSADDPEAGPDAEPGDEPGDEPPEPGRDTSVCTRRGGVELRVRLSTVLGRDDHPGELAGWGPVHAALALDLATGMAGAQWRFAITNDSGQLVCCGITRARPAGARRPGVAVGAGGAGRSPVSTADIVELQIPAALLDALAADSDAPVGWTNVIADLARERRRHLTGGDPFSADETRRMPGAALRRYVDIRDRCCIFRGCRTPARTTDIDHTVDHGHGGRTVEDNLGGPCRHDHMLKHEGGWRLHQPEPGVFHWTSRLGHTYTVLLPPIIGPLPDPLPRDGPHYPIWVEPDDGWQDSTILEEAPPERDPQPGPEPVPVHDPEADPPPF